MSLATTSCAARSGHIGSTFHVTQVGDSGFLLLRRQGADEPAALGTLEARSGKRKMHIAFRSPQQVRMLLTGHVAANRRASMWRTLECTLWLALITQLPCGYTGSCGLSTRPSNSAALPTLATHLTLDLKLPMMRPSCVYLYGLATCWCWLLTAYLTTWMRTTCSM